MKRRPLSNGSDLELSAALAAIAPAGVLIGHRLIAVGDEDCLHEAELAGMEGASVKVRRQSGAARIVARDLLERCGIVDACLVRASSGAPMWPRGVRGSLAHDPLVAVAVVASAARYKALGVDVEPAIPLPDKAFAAVATPSEASRYAAEPLAGRVLLAAKEAVYKAVNPLDGVFLAFSDVEVDLAGGRAWTRQGLTLKLSVVTQPRVVALAHLNADDGHVG